MAASYLHIVGLQAATIPVAVLARTLMWHYFVVQYHFPSVRLKRRQMPTTQLSVTVTTLLLNRLLLDRRCHISRQ